MSKLSKKAVSVGLAFATVVWLSGAALMIPQAKAATVEELQAQIAALLAQITALQAQLNQGVGTPASCTFTRDLTVGSKGDDVKCLQQWLNGNGYQVAASGAGSSGNESTYFGNLTKAAVAKFQAAKGITPAVGYFGPKTRAAIGTGGVVTPLPPVGSGLTISLAADNPAAASIPKGAAAVPYLKFNVYGNGTIDSLTFKRIGNGAAADFDSAGINIYEGNTRLTSGKTINSTTHEVTFVNLGLAVSGTKTLTLTANVAGSPTTGNIDAFQLISAAGTPTPTGFPITGSSMSISGISAGGVTVDDGSSPSNPNIGQTEAKLLDLQVTANSTEDIEIQRIALSEGGTVNNDYLTNFKMKYADQVVATADKVGAKDLVTFSFGTPYKIEKGQQKTFSVYGDISGTARSSDTVILYIDSTSDVVAKGLLYGYNVSSTITDVDTTSESDTLTLQGANITMNFIGPVTGDVALRGQDAELFKFNFTSKNNIEIKNFRFGVTTTGLTSGEGFNDFKLWDAVSNTLLTSATDITTSTTVVFTDTTNVSANQTRTFKITADIDSDNDAGDNIRVQVNPFGTTDIRNLDNNTYVVPSTDVTPNSVMTGNTQSVKTPGLEIGLAASPSSRTYVQGTQNVAFAGFTFLASADDVKLTQIKVYATSSTGTLTAAELTNLRLYDGETQLGNQESLDSALTATFDNFNLIISKDSTKTLTVKANIAADASNGDVYYIYINATTDVYSYDSNGNSLTNSGIAANNGGAVSMTIANVGDVTVVTADTSVNADIILAGSEQTLGRYDFTATNEDMTIKNLHIMISSSSSATATTTDTGDDIPYIRLFDGTDNLGDGTGTANPCTVNNVSYYGCFAVPISGASSSIVQISNLGWIVPANTTKTLTVKGLVDKIGFSGVGADSGTNIWAHIQATGFKASGQTTDDTSITAASGREKVIYKTKPILSKLTTSAILANGGPTEAFNFRVAADSAGDIEWKKISFYVRMTGATMSAASTANIDLDDITGSSPNLSLATLYSSSTEPVYGAPETIPGTITGGYVTLDLTNVERISAGSYKDYRLKLTFTEVNNSPNDNVTISLYRSETSVVNGTWYSGIVDGSASTTAVSTSSLPSFVWSDRSALSHATSTGDWANGVYVKTFDESSSIHN